MTSAKGTLINWSSLPRYPKTKLTDRNGAFSNGTFLFSYDDGFRAAPGWNAIGYAEAPCIKLGCLAIVFERNDDPVGKYELHGGFDPGTVIWHHMVPGEFPEGHEAYNLICK